MAEVTVNLFFHAPKWRIVAARIVAECLVALAWCGVRIDGDWWVDCLTAFVMRGARFNIDA